MRGRGGGGGTIYFQHLIAHVKININKLRRCVLACSQIQTCYIQPYFNILQYKRKVFTNSVCLYVRALTVVNILKFLYVIEAYYRMLRNENRSFQYLQFVSNTQFRYKKKIRYTIIHLEKSFAVQFNDVTRFQI